jgi:Bacterial signalling protein N terminal repeat
MISPGTTLVGFYDDRLVALSVFIAILAAGAALDLAGRVTSARGMARRAWLGGGAFAMGVGIWSMHYIGMLAFHLPVPVLYNWPTVLISLLAAVLASWVSLFVVSRQTMRWPQAITGGPSAHKRLHSEVTSSARRCPHSRAVRFAPADRRPCRKNRRRNNAQPWAQ